MEVLLATGLMESFEAIRPWKEGLDEKKIASKIIETKPEKNWSFENRVSSILKAINESKKPVRIIGHSAGGLATLVALSKIVGQEFVKSAVVVSPAMPRGISPWGMPLLTKIPKYLPHILLTLLSGRSFSPSKEDIRYLTLNGVSPENKERIINEPDQPISGKEAMDFVLNNLRPDIEKIDAPTLIVCGEEDRWVNPNAFHKLFDLIQKINLSGKTSMYRWPECGHLPAHNKKHGKDVVEKAINFLLSH